MNRLRLGLAIGTLLIASASSAYGQRRARPISVVFSGGATVPTSGAFKDTHDLGVHGDVGLILSLFGQSLRLRPEISYTRFSVKDIAAAYAAGLSSSSNTAVYGSDAASTLLGAFGNIELPVGPLYVIAGLGAVNFKSDTGATAATSGQFSETKVSINGGAGIRFSLGPISGFIEGRLNSISLDKGKEQFKDVKTIPVTFGLVF